MPGFTLIVIHLCRKPLVRNTVTASVLEEGAGALNIDASRVGTERTTTSISGGRGFGSNFRDDGWVPPSESSLRENPPGRWPANLILQHATGCRLTGTREVPGISGGSTSGHNALGQGSGWNSHRNRETPIRRSETEMVPVWECGEGCVVADFNADPRFFKQVKREP